MSESVSKIFISYSRVDSGVAEALKEGLEASGYTVLIDRDGIAHGEDWQARLRALIRECDTVVFVLSPDSASSAVCGWEIEESRAQSKRVIPVLWRPVDFSAAPAELGALNAVPFDGANAITGLQKLVAALESDLEWLREHTRVGERADEWERTGRSDAFLLRGAALRSAQAWRDAKPAAAPALTEAHRAYLRASEEEEIRVLSDERRRADELVAAKELAEIERDSAEQARANETTAARRVVRTTLAGLAAALTLSLAAGVAGWSAYRNGLAFERAADEAQANASRAEAAAAVAREEAARADASAREAIAQRDATLRLESRLLARSAQEARAAGDVAQALALARRALPADLAAPDRPFAPEALQALYDAWFDLRERVTIRDPDNPVRGAAPGPDGTLLSWSARGQTAALWSADGAQLAAVRHAPAAHDEVTPLNGGVLADGRFLTWGGFEAPLTKVWDRDGALLRELNDVSVMALSPGGRIVSAVVDAEGAFEREALRLANADGTIGPRIDLDGPYLGAVFAGETRLLIHKLVLPPFDPPRPALEVRDPETGALLHQLTLAEGGVSRLHVLDERRVLAIGERVEAAIVWDVLRGAEIARLAPPSGRVDDAAMLADGRFVTWGDDGSGDIATQVWTAGGARAFALADGHVFGISGAALAPDGRIVTWSQDGAARFYDPATGAETLSLNHDEDGDRVVDSWVLGVSFVAEDRVVTWSSDGAARLWRTDRAEPVAVLRGHEGELTGAATLPGARLASWSRRDGTLRFWSTAPGPQGRVLRPEDAPTRRIHGVDVAPDGRVLVFGVDGALRLWDPAFQRETAVIASGLDEVTDAAISPAGRIVAFGPISEAGYEGPYGGRMIGADGAPGPALAPAHDAHVIGTRFAPDGRVVSWSGDETIRIWSAETGALEAVIQSPGGVSGVDIGPDGRILAFASGDGARLWAPDGAAGPVLVEDGALGAAFLEDGRIAVWGREVRLFSAEGALQTTVDFDGAFAAAAVARDGWSVLWRQGEARVFDAAGARQAVLTLPAGAISSAIFLEDGRIVTFGGRQAPSRVWERDGSAGPALRDLDRNVRVGQSASAPDGRILAWTNHIPGAYPPTLWYDPAAPGVRLSDHELSVSDAAFLPNGDVLVWARYSLDGSDDHLPRVWPGDPASMLAAVDALLARLQPLTAAERCRFFLETGDACPDGSAAAD